MFRRLLVPSALLVLALPALLACSQRTLLLPTVDDPDGDGIPSSIDNCPFVVNPDQANCDLDEFGDVCDLMDSDGDLIADYLDNCPCVANPGQEDSDLDGRGDLCDGGSTITDTTATASRTRWTTARPSPTPVRPTAMRTAWATPATTAPRW